MGIYVFYQLLSVACTMFQLIQNDSDCKMVIVLTLRKKKGFPLNCGMLVSRINCEMHFFS